MRGNMILSVTNKFATKLTMQKKKISSLNKFVLKIQKWNDYCFVSDLEMLKEMVFKLEANVAT